MMKTLKLILVTLFVITNSCAQEKSDNSKAKQPDDESVDYSKASNIIKAPEKLTGDEKAIFYHSYFLKLTHKEIKNLDPLKVKEEFRKLGITVDERARYVAASSFFITYYRAHKKSCEQWESFKDLAPETKN